MSQLSLINMESQHVLEDCSLDILHLLTAAKTRQTTVNYYSNIFLNQSNQFKN